MSNGTRLRARRPSDPDFEKLVKLLTAQAATYPAGVGPYYDNLIRQTPLTDPFRQEKIGTFHGPAAFDARALLEWAWTKGGNPREPAWTTLGSLLRALLEAGTLGLEQAALVAAAIDAYDLYLSSAEAARFRATYGVPEQQADAAAVGPDVGPDIDWRGPTDAVQLQSWLGPKPTDFAVSVLQLIVQRARSVCKVEFPAVPRSGSGVLVARDLVLTNHHVVFGEAGDESLWRDLAKNCVVSFGGLAGTGGPAEASGPLDAAADPLVARSRPLDYALLRLSPELAATGGLATAPIAARHPVAKDGLNLLHHPLGQAMRATLCDAGVVEVLVAPPYLQYITRSAEGSSGAPCFDDDWRIVALHRSERSRPFGRVGEGILMHRIQTEIQRYLA